MGPRLRGNVYTQYANAYWLANDNVGAKVDVLADRMNGEAPGEGPERAAVIRHASEAADRYFLPLDAAVAKLLSRFPARVQD